MTASNFTASLAHITTHCQYHNSDDVLRTGDSFSKQRTNYISDGVIRLTNMLRSKLGENIFKQIVIAPAFGDRNIAPD